MDYSKEMVDITRQLGDVESKLEKSKLEIIDKLELKFQVALQKTENNLAANTQYQISQAVQATLSIFKKEMDEAKKEIDQAYAGKWVENFMRWLLYLIGGSIVAWFSGIIGFVSELFYKAK